MSLSATAIDDLLHRAWDAQTKGKLDTALALYRQVLAQADHAPAWLGLGQCLLEQKDHPAALAAFQRASALRPDSGAIRHMVVMLQDGPAPERAPDDYVLWVFDGHAASFDAHLAALDYRGPQMIARLAEQAWDRTPSRAILDLGCGTGLNAPLFRPYASRLDGVDLAPGMLRLASQRGYDHLYKAEIHAFLKQPPVRYDVLLSTDVFIYIGDLEKVFSYANQHLSDRGEILCTIELGAEGDPPIRLMPSGRFRQTDRYIRDRAAAAGFRIAESLDDRLRIEQGQGEPGRAYRIMRQ